MTDTNQPLITNNSDISKPDESTELQPMSELEKLVERVGG